MSGTQRVEMTRNAKAKDDGGSNDKKDKKTKTFLPFTARARFICLNR